MKPHKRDKQCILYPGVHYLNSEKTRVADVSLCTQCQEITEGFKVRALSHPLSKIVLCFECEAISPFEEDCINFLNRHIDEADARYEEAKGSHAWVDL